MLVSEYLNYGVEHILTATILSINSLLISSYVDAQVVPDSTLNTQVDLVDGQQKITGGRELGTYLFHSFKEFSPTVNFVTHFDNNSNIENIFTRVTGGSASLIDGLVKTNDNASLFILNPAGIIFGNNAALEIGGSFIATTAESIIFADGTKFDTDINQTEPLLTVSIPIGLQYGNSSGAISSNNTNLIELKNLYEENTIAFLGGNIELQNISIEALSGNVEISGVAEGEIVGLKRSTNGWEFQYGNDSEFNDIKISQQFQIDTSGKLGNINLRGQEILILLSNSDSFLLNDTSTNTNGGEISLIATNDIEINNLFVSSQVAPPGDNEELIIGKGRDIFISAKDINIHDSIISASTLNQGKGGDIRIEAKGVLRLSGVNKLFGLIPSVILTNVGDSGNGGNINIQTGKLELTEGASISSSSFGLGKAGTIKINANESIFISGSFFDSTQDLEIKSGVIASSGFDGAISSFFGESGSITINAPQISIKDGGEISVSNFGEKDAGDIEINIGDLLVEDDSQITAITASGDGGSINISGSEIILKDESLIATSAGGKGNGGNIDIDTNSLVLFDDSAISADAFEGSGGNITITTKSLLTEKSPEKMITASSEFGLNGTVEVTLPDTDSKLETTQVRIASLAGEESLYKGCSLGTDFSANRFSYIGRGGIRRGPFDPLESQDAIADLGFGDDSEFENINIQTNKNLYNYDKIIKSSKPITEASAWIINEEGKVELVAQATSYSVPSECLFK